jgi:hypothetical protein
MAREQLRRMNPKDQSISIDQIEASESDQIDHKIKKKNALAKKLIQEKEEVIQRGLKQRMREIEFD